MEAIKSPQQNIEVPSFVHSQSKERTTHRKTDYERTPQTDTFEVHTPHKKPKKPSKAPLVIVGTTGAIMGFIAGMNANDLQKTKPEQYDYIQEAIEEASDPDIIDALTLKQEKQKEIATAHKDGDFVYYIINPSDEDSGTIRIGANNFKSLFDIEDGALKKYNNLHSYYEKTEPDPDGKSGVYSYDLHVFSSGDMVKVPISAIKMDNIDLDDFYTLDNIDYTITDEDAVDNNEEEGNE